VVFIILFIYFIFSYFDLLQQNWQWHGEGVVCGMVRPRLRDNELSRR